MNTTFPVLWVFRGETSTGSLEITPERLLFDSRRRSFSCPFARVVRAELERGPAERIRGLPAVRMLLTEGDELRIASLAGAGTALELASQIVVNVPGVL